MGEADELLFVTEGDDAMPVLNPEVPQALSRDTPTLTSSSKRCGCPRRFRVSA
jgi:hypothetical protein